MRKRGYERFRQAPVLWQKDARMGMAANGFCQPSAGLQRNQWCTFSRPAAAAFFPYKAQGKRSTSVLAPHPCFCAVLQHRGFVEHPQQGHLFFFCQLGIVDADLLFKDADPEMKAKLRLALLT